MAVGEAGRGVLGLGRQIQAAPPLFVRFVAAACMACILLFVCHAYYAFLHSANPPPWGLHRSHSSASARLLLCAIDFGEWGKLLLPTYVFLCNIAYLLNVLRPLCSRC